MDFLDIIQNIYEQFNLVKQHNMVLKTGYAIWDGRISQVWVSRKPLEI